jgi:hypothetical protein
MKSLFCMRQEFARSDVAASTGSYQSTSRNQTSRMDVGRRRRRDRIPERAWLDVETAVSKVSLTLLFAVFLFVTSQSCAQDRWTEAQANAWYTAQPWPVGADFLPSTAINELEMWQADTFDPQTIDRELGWAEGIGMNTMRVFLHNLLWEQDPDGFRKRIDTFLTIAARHKIRPIFVLFDSCWEPFPKLGPQHPPIPGVHNSGWVQAPGAAVLADPAQYPKLKEYVVGVVGTFAADPRVLAWDVWNEPSDENPSVYGNDQPVNTKGVVLKMVLQAFAWARSAHPMQPLTSGVVDGDAMPPMARMQIEESDVISFHNYSWPEIFEKRVLELQKFHRPLICTEYMARSAGSTIDTILPIAHKYRVGAINWGFVTGKSQTLYPWDSWQRPYVSNQPTIWFHDLFHPDGKPYREREVEIIRDMTSGKEPPL